MERIAGDRSRERGCIENIHRLSEPAHITGVVVTFTTGREPIESHCLSPETSIDHEVRLWPRLFLFGVFTVLAVARSLGEQEVRVGPVVPDVSLWWFVVAGAGAFFVSPTSDFELRRDGLFGLTLGSDGDVGVFVDLAQRRGKRSSGEGGDGLPRS